MRILHLLSWRLQDIIKELDNIANQGFDAIQINPIQPLKEDNFNHWWMSFQPCGFQIGNQYGSRKDFEDLCYEANYHNIKIIVDVICNHMAGQNDGSLVPNEKVDPSLKNNPYFWKEAKNISNWESRYEVTNYCIGLPGIQVSNYDLQDKVTNFLNDLIHLGASGFRFDAAKNIALPEEGCNFWPRVINNLDHYGLYNYGEVIFASDELLGKYCEHMNVITNSYCSKKDQLVAYAENHDSYLHFGYTKCKSEEEINGNYWWVTSEYPNTLYYARPFSDNWKKEIVKNANQKMLVRK